MNNMHRMSLNKTFTSPTKKKNYNSKNDTRKKMRQLIKIT